MPIKIFCCYSRKDQAHLNDLKNHLIPLQRGGLISIWNDTDISPGTNYEAEINKHLNTANIILLLISPDFMASDYCYSNEMQQALARHNRRTARVIPIILRPVIWKEAPFGKIQALPADGKPITSWPNKDEALFDVAEGIRKIIEQLKEFTVVRTLEGHFDIVTTVAISPDGETLASGSWDETIRIWNLHTAEELYTLTENLPHIYSVSISPDGQMLVSGSDNNTIVMWNLKTKQFLRFLDGEPTDKIGRHSVRSVVISPNNQMLVSGRQDGTIKIWELLTGQPVRTLEGHSKSVISVAISPDGQFVVSCSHDATIMVWSLQTGQLLRTLKAPTRGMWPPRSMSSVAISPDGQIIVSGSDYGTSVWNLHTGRLLHINDGHLRDVEVSSMEYRDGQKIERTMLIKEPSQIVSVAISPDGQIIASGGSDGTIEFWNLDTGKMLYLRKEHSDAILSISFSSDGQVIATGSYDHTVKIWERNKLP